MLHTKLAAMKARCGLSKQQIADKSGVPLSTVNRVFSGQTDNPTFHTVVDLVRAMGGSLNELDDVLPPTEEEQATPEKVPEKFLEIYERQVRLYEQQAKQKDKWMKFLFIACASLTAILVGILFLDVLNGNIGYFRY